MSCPGAVVTALPDPLRTGRAATNPSIAAHPDFGFVVSVRHVNYRITDDGSYAPLAGSELIVTELEMVRLDDDLRVIDRVMVDDHRARSTPPRWPVHGLEDLRLFRRDGRWFGSATIREHRSDGRCDMVLVTFTQDMSAVEEAEVMRSPARDRHEKNWMPIDGPGAHRFLWGAQPPIVATFDPVLGVATTEVSVPEWIDPGAARGGSQVIRVGDHFVCVVHHVRLVEVRGAQRRRYGHRLVVLDAGFRTIASSDEFVFEAPGIEFCAGLAVTARGLVMSYGVDDGAARLVEVPWLDLARWLPVLPSLRG